VISVNVAQLTDIAGVSMGLIEPLETMTKVSEKFAAAKLGDFVNVLTATSQHIVGISKIMQTMDEIDLDATIDKFGKNMSVANKTVSISGGAVKVNVKLNLTIGAQKLAETLVLDGFVAPSDGFKKFIGDVDGIDDDFYKDDFRQPITYTGTR
jgi:hypothetical protein